ncbi:MAG: AIR synthase-related protein [Egibacteraceae bacterium]
MRRPGRSGASDRRRGPSVGGLVVAVAECALPGGLGVRLVSEGGVAACQWLFSESPTRVVVSVRPADAGRLAGLCAARGVGCRRLGVVLAEPCLEFGGVLTLDLAEVRRVYEQALPAALGQ